MNAIRERALHAGVRGAAIALVVVAVVFAPAAAVPSPARLVPPASSSFDPSVQTVLYAANTANDSVDVYAVAGTRLTFLHAITNGVQHPIDVFVSAGGTLYVANDDSVIEYPPGAMAPAVRLPLPIVSQYLSVGADGTVFVCGYKPKTFRFVVAEFDPGMRSESREVRFNNSQPYPLQCGGVAADASGNLYVNVGSYNSGGGFKVNVYPPKHVVPDRFFRIRPAPYPGGGLEIAGGLLFMGDFNDNALYVTTVLKPHPVRKIRAPANYFSLDAARRYLYVPAGDTLRIYDVAGGMLAGELRGTTVNGVAIFPRAR